MSPAARPKIILPFGRVAGLESPQENSHFTGSALPELSSMVYPRSLSVFVQRRPSVPRDGPGES